jgi:hypothetical protein
MGIGNGAVISYEGVIFQTVVPEHLLGRFFGIKNSIVSWCFGGAFLAGGALTAAIGPRALFVLAGAGTLATCWFGTIKLRSAWTEPAASETQPAASATPAEAFFGLNAPGLAAENA